MRTTLLAETMGLFVFVSVGATANGNGQGQAFINHLNQISSVGSTVPANGDVNPYGVAIVPRSVGSLVANNILVSNFNNSTNAQGTGTTIVQITPEGNLSVFAEIAASAVPTCTGGVGLTTALVVLRSGWVIVGSLPTANGMAATAQAGCLIVLNSQGKPVETFSGNGINGLWDMTALDLSNFAVLFVSNVLNGTMAANGAAVNQGTVLRMVLAMGDGDGDNDDASMPKELSRTEIASGFAERTDPSALVIGPTGLALAFDGTLYVADTLANRVAAIPFAVVRGNSAGTGDTVSQNGSLNGPLGLAIAPNGDILTVNGGDGNMVEVSRAGTQVSAKNVDTTGAGAGTLFGLTVKASGNGVYFVNDGNNTLNLLH
jgi:hypothetical protein